MDGQGDGAPRYTVEEFRRNLVTAGMIATRLGIKHAAHVSMWQKRYDDYPEPVLQGTLPHGRTGGNQAWYWWPDVEAFARRHGLPKPRRHGLTREQLAWAQAQRDAGKTLTEIAAALGVARNTIRNRTWPKEAKR